MKAEAEGTKAGRVMITGAAGNLGAALLNAFACNGTFLVLADMNVAKLHAMTASMPRDNVRVVGLDVTSSEDWDRVAHDPELAVDQLDALILAAGTTGPVAPVEEMRESDFDTVMNVNVKGVWLGLKTCLPRMKARKRGVVLVVASLSGRMGTPLLASYSASKHAVIGLVRSAAREVAKDGVRVNAIAPGPIDSELMSRIDKELLAINPTRFSGREDARTSVPIGRYVSVDEVAALSVFLCSEDSGGCTGGVFPIDGGVGTW